MSELELELITRISKLDHDKQQQLLSYARALDEKPPFSFDEWLERVRAIRAEQPVQQISVQELLDEVREEPTDERLGRV